jgi:group I intron endonuclease
MIGLIYRILLPATGKSYIGQTQREVQIRFEEHCRDGRCPINRALKKYGRDAATVTILDTAESVDELNAKEMLWIGHFDSVKPHGYNLTAGGEGNKKASDETRRKMSDAAKIRNARPEIKAQQSKAMSARMEGNQLRRGMTLTEQHRMAISKWARARPPCLLRLSRESQEQDEERRGQIWRR